MKRTYAKEIPSDYMIRELKKSEEDVKAGRISPGFENIDDAIAWLDDPNRKYVRDLYKRGSKKFKELTRLYR